MIRAVAPDGSVVARSPAQWLDGLPEPASLLGRVDRDTPVRSARVAVRSVVENRKVYGERGYLNRVEVYGDEADAALDLLRDRVRIRWDGQGTEDWPFDALTAVQASSGALQLKRRGHPLASFRFLDDSVFLWEELVREGLRDFYGRTGRGAIREFQPRIVTR
jgi:hypothetical protein